MDDLILTKYETLSIIEAFYTKILKKYQRLKQLLKTGRWWCDAIA